MIGQRAVNGVVQFDFTGLDELIDELGMMDDLVISAHLRIFMFQRIETMGTRGDYFFDVIAIQRFDVFLGRHLVEHFISDTSGKVAGAFFFRPENRKADLGLLQQGGFAPISGPQTVLAGQQQCAPLSAQPFPDRIRPTGTGL